MKIYSNTFDFHIDEPTVVTIGKFDGGHMGHLAVFNEMRKIKANEGLKMAAFTFAFFNTPQILNLSEKRNLMEKEGFDYLIEFPFTEEVKSIDGKNFLLNILIGKLNMKHFVAGSDCAFGHNKSGNTSLLNEYKDKYNYELTIIDKLKEDDKDISSTLIREYIDKGDVSKIIRLLGVPYSITGEVVVGNKLGGKDLGFPTINILPTLTKIFPKEGVYATRVTLPDGSKHIAMTNIGRNPSISNDRFNHAVRCESNIFDFDGNLYGKIVTLEFLDFIRDEITFKSIDELKQQLCVDKLTILSRNFGL